MKIELWQLIGLITWTSAILGLLFAYELPISRRIGGSLILSGLLLTVGRSLMPRPAMRKHVDNELTLQKWNDAFLFGIPALFLLIVGCSLLICNIVLGCVCAIVFMTVYYCFLITQ